MIFLTVGTQAPFDRLARSVDLWAASRHRDDVFAQIGTTRWEPENMAWAPILDPSLFRRYLCEADVVVTHAGMGTILTALEFRKPTLIVPRRADLLETADDHQFGTARALEETRGISIAWDEEELLGWLDHLDSIPAPERAAAHASLRLLTTLKRFIAGDGADARGDGGVETITFEPAGYVGPERKRSGDRRKAA